jgi:hypothetical protein
VPEPWTKIELEGGRVVIVVEQTIYEVAGKLNEAQGERVTFRPVWYGDDAAGEFDSTPIAIRSDEIHEISETCGPDVLSDGRRAPPPAWAGRRPSP